MAMLAVAFKPDIEQPRWDQGTYWGRARHFFTITNPLNLLCTNRQLNESKEIVEKYRKGEVEKTLTVEALWRAKHIYDSAYHPDTKEKMLLIGRMSAQVPMNMLITGCMMTFYRTNTAIVFWQWINQSFNAVVNYTNRSGENPIPIKQLLVSYACATGGALVTALGLNSVVKKAPPLIGRFVPFVAVAAANCVNIPLMRMRELKNGIAIYDEKNKKLGESRLVARHAITMVVISRIAMATPGMVFPPFIMNSLEKKRWYMKRAYLGAPIQIGLVGLFLIFATPMCCAFFPQKSSIKTDLLENSLREDFDTKKGYPSYAYYNKGL